MAKPVAFYSDKDGVFRVNSTGAVEGDGMTQFGRSLHALNIDILCANTPQAKGRVERANKTDKPALHRLDGIVPRFRFSVPHETPRASFSSSVSSSVIVAENYVAPLIRGRGGPRLGFKQPQVALDSRF